MGGCGVDFLFFGMMLGVICTVWISIFVISSLGVVTIVGESESFEGSTLLT